MRITLLSKLILSALIGFAALMPVLSACRHDNGKPLTINRDLPPASLEAAIDKKEAAVGDRITYTLSLSRSPEIAADLPEITATPDGLTQVDSGHSGPLSEQGRISEKRWTTYRVDRIGTSVFPAVKTRYQQNGMDKEIETQTITMQVKSVLTQEMTDIHGIKPLEQPKPDMRFLFAVAALVIIVIVLAFLAWSRWEKRTGPEASQLPLPPHLEAEQRLRELEAMGLIAKGNFKEHYFLLSEIFRRYLERRFVFPAVERTTEEILTGLALLRVTDDLKDEVRTFLTNTEPVKFAGAGSSIENANAETDRVRRFVAATSQPAPASIEEKEHVAV